MEENKDDLLINKLKEELNITQSMLDSLMLQDSCTASFSLLRRNNKSTYIAMRIINNERNGVTNAHNAYKMFLNNTLCADLKNDVDEILREHDKEHLIVDNI